MSKSNFLGELDHRGLIQDTTDREDLEKRLADSPLTVYHGIDPSAPSLHIGNFIGVLMLRRFQDAGHKPIALIGGSTGMIGDPGGRSEERNLLDEETLQNNLEGIRAQLEKLVDLDNATLVNNFDWTKNVNVLDFLRDVGKHATINQMVGRESVRSRMESTHGISFTEFSYMLLQAFDFWWLHKNFNCELQIGGSDQWGNIVNGIDLTRRSTEVELFGLTSPLLETSEGKKMGKSQDGAIWLDKKLLSSYQFWQFWRNTADADVGKFLKLYTEISIDECMRLENIKGAELNEAKIILANHVTSLLHGDDASQAAEKTATDVFIKGSYGDELPTLEISLDELGDGLSIVQLFVRTGLVHSGKEAKRLISENGARLNDSLLDNHTILINQDDLMNQVKLSAGKKRHALVKLKK